MRRRAGAVAGAAGGGGPPPAPHQTGRSQRTPRSRLCRAADVALC